MVVNFELTEAEFRLLFEQFGDENLNFSAARAFDARVALVYFSAAGASKNSAFCVLDFGGILFCGS